MMKLGEKLFILISLMFAFVFFLIVVIKTLEIYKDSEAASRFEDLSIQQIINDQKILQAYLEKEGINKTMDRLIADSKGGSSYDCHQQAHNIGRIGYELIGEDAFGQCNASCHSGCYHGAMESFFNKNGTANLGQNMERICNKFKTYFGNFECLHGVGHGILAYENYDLPKAIGLCRELKDTLGQRSCYGGLFMENIITAQGSGATEQNHTTEWVNRDDPFMPCNKIDQNDELQYECWQMQTSWMLTIFNNDIDAIAKECKKAPKEMIPTCYKSLGRDISGLTLRNPEKIKTLCEKTPREFRNNCIEGALNVIVDFNGPDLRDQATQLCKLYQGENKEACYTFLTTRIGGLFEEKDRKHIICNTFGSPHREKCINMYN